MTDMPEIHKPHEKTKTNFKTKKNKTKQKTSEIACEETRRPGTNFSEIVKFEFPSGSKLNN